MDERNQDPVGDSTGSGHVIGVRWCYRSSVPRRWRFEGQSKRLEQKRERELGPRTRGFKGNLYSSIRIPSDSAWE